MNASKPAVASRRPAWLTRNLGVLTAVSLMQDAASELVYPLLPVFLSATLGAPPVVVGSIEGVAQATSGLTQYVSGRLSDRTKRRPWVAWGYGLAAVGKILVAAAFAWPMVLLGRVTDRFGKGIRSSPRDALISESVPRETLGRAFGFHRAGDTVGAVIGPLIGLLVLHATSGDVRTALWIATIPAALAVGLVLLVREPPRHVVTDPAELAALPDATADSGLDASDVLDVAVEALSPRRLLRSPLPTRFWKVTIALTLVALVNFPDVLVLLRLEDLGWSASQVVLGYVLFNISYAVLSFPAGAVADRVGPATVYGLGLLFFAVGYLGLGLTDGGWTVVVLLVLYGAFPALTDGVGKAWISSLVGDEMRGRAMGVFQGLGSGAILVAGLWAGLAWNLGAGAGVVPLVISGIVGGAAGLLLLAAAGRLRPVPAAEASA